MRVYKYISPLPKSQCTNPSAKELYVCIQKKDYFPAKQSYIKEHIPARLEQVGATIVRRREVIITQCPQSRQRAVCIRKTDLYSRKRALYKNTYTRTNRATRCNVWIPRCPHSCKEPYVSAKEIYIPAKEIYIPTKEACISAKKTHISTQEPCIQKHIPARLEREGAMSGSPSAHISSSMSWRCDMTHSYVCDMTHSYV